MLLTLGAAGAAGWPPMRPWIWGLDLIVFGVALYDWLRTPAVKDFSVLRSLPVSAGLSRALLRRVELQSERAAGLQAEIYELYPKEFSLCEAAGDGISQADSGGAGVGTLERGVLDAMGKLVLEQSYVCHQRGLFEFGDLRLRLSSRLGLWQRQARFEARAEVAIEPALAGLKKSLRLAASDRWQDLGVRKLQRRGGETEFESLRDYVPGDDVRRMDWKAFARRGKPMLRQYQVERGQELILMIDTGRRMRITTKEGGARGWSKLDWALDAALQLAAVALSKGDRVGAAGFGQGLEVWVAPARGAQQRARLGQALFGLQPSFGDANLTQSLLELSLRHRRRATVIILSDVADPYSVHAQQRALASASKRHRVIFAALDDPGLRRLAGSAGVESVPAALRAAALELLEDRRSALVALSSSGARVLDALPADAAAPLLSAWLSERRR